MKRSFLLLSLAGLTAALQPTSDAEARKRQNGAVVACSRYGNGCYEAQVRPGRYGPQMRLKGGTWIDCRGDCREALREETVDFWETQNDKAMAAGP